MLSKRTLILSGSEKGLDVLTDFLKKCGFQSISVLTSGSEARRHLSQTNLEYELILINTPLKDEFGHQLALKLAKTTCAGVLLICKNEIAEEMTNKTIDYGIFVTSKPLNKTALHQAIRLSAAMNARMLLMKQDYKKLQNKLEELRLVCRAKCVLVETKHYTEAEAHRWLEKEAMDSRRTRRDVALDILETYQQDQMDDDDSE